MDWYNGVFGIRLPWGYPHALDTAQITSLASMLAGALLLTIVLPRFLRGKEEHRILEQLRRGQIWITTLIENALRKSLPPS